MKLHGLGSFISRRNNLFTIEDDLRAKDADLRGNDTEPVRPAGLQPDSFDKP